MGWFWSYTCCHLMYSDWLVFAHFYCTLTVTKSHQEKQKIGTRYWSRYTLSCQAVFNGKIRSFWFLIIIHT